MAAWRWTWLGVMAQALPVSAADATPLALWLCDEPAGVQAGLVLRDALPAAHDITLAGDGELVAGKFGRALRPAKLLPPPSARETAGAVRANPAAPAFRRARDASRLNLGAGDWTIECWLRVDGSAREEGALFEVGVGPASGEPIAMRFSVLPAENAFALTAVRPPEAGASGLELRRVEVAPADGPRGSHVAFQTLLLDLRAFPLPRAVWVHVALVHVAARETAVLFVDGHRRAEAMLAMASLPAAGAMYAMIGCDGGGGRRLEGALDEVRISEGAAYGADFTPPGTFARPGQRGLAHE